MGITALFSESFHLTRLRNKTWFFRLPNDSLTFFTDICRCVTIVELLFYILLNKITLLWIAFDKNVGPFKRFDRETDRHTGWVKHTTHRSYKARAQMLKKKKDMEAFKVDIAYVCGKKKRKKEMAHVCELAPNIHKKRRIKESTRLQTTHH